MQTGSKTLRRLTAAALFLAVGAALMYLSYRITPAMGDRSIGLSEWRSLYRIGGAVSSFGYVFLAIGAFLLFASRLSALRARRVRHHHAHNSDATPPKE
jgi:TRAP-type C4-dicarboxylate transport system permease small subunit